MGLAGKRLGALACGAALAGGLTACGDDDSGSGGSGPASVVPAGAPVYGETVIRPEGDERETIERVIMAATGEEDPGSFVVEKLNEAIASSDGELTSWEEDFEPWLGERLAFFYPDAEAALDDSAAGTTDCVADASIAPDDALFGEEPGDITCPSSEDGEFAGVIVESTDADAAREAIEKLAAEEAEDPPEEASYEGVDYLADSKGNSAGVVGDFVVVGSEDAFKAVVDTEAGGESLDDADDFDDTIADVGEDPTAALYVDTPALIDAAEERGELDAETRAFLDLSLGGTEAPLAVGAKIEAETISLTSVTGVSPEDEGLEQSTLLEDAPADAWVAAGTSAVGERLSAFVQAFSETAPAEFEAAQEEFGRQTGVELTDLYEPLGDAAIFVTGTSPLSVQGAAVIETSDPEASADLLDSLGKLALRQGEEVMAIDLPEVEDAVGFEVPAEGAPGSVLVFVAADRLVVAYGEDAATLAAGVGETEALVDSDGFQAAADALGDDYEVGGYVDSQAIAELVGAIPVSDAEVTPEQVADGIDAFDFLVTGARVDDDRRVDRYVVGLSE